MKAQDLIDDQVYSYTEFKEVLKEHGLPYTDVPIRKLETKGVIPSPRLPTAESDRAEKVYTGKLIKEIVAVLIKKIEEIDYASGTPKKIE